MKRRHDLGAFADGSSHPLDRAWAHVADGEDTLAIRFQRMTPHSVVDSCPDKAFLVQRHTAFREPVRIRIGSDEQKEMADRVCHLFATRAVAPAHAFKIAFMTFKCGDFGSRQHVDVGLRLDAFDEVMRHAGLQTSAAREQPHSALAKTFSYFCGSDAKSKACAA